MLQGNALCWLNTDANRRVKLAYQAPLAHHEDPLESQFKIPSSEVDDTGNSDVFILPGSQNCGLLNYAGN